MSNFKNSTLTTATVTQQVGSFERWDEADARTLNASTAATYRMLPGVNLELNTSLSNTVVAAGSVIQIDGGSISGFLRADDDALAVYRTIGSNVTVQMMSNSFVGMADPDLAGNDIYDAGKYNNNVNPFVPNITGAILVMDGAITDGSVAGTNYDLTKTGSDLVILNSTSNVYRNTIVREGILQIGATNALPTAHSLIMEGSGTFDLNGFDQQVGSVSGGSGTIMNSGAAAAGNMLKVGNDGTSTTYGGVMTGNLNLTKEGAGTLNLSGANTYVGTTTVNAGTLVVSGSLNGTTQVDVTNAALAGSGSITTGIVSAATGLNGNVTMHAGSSLAPTPESTLSFNLGSGALDLTAITNTGLGALKFTIDPLGTTSEVAVNSGTLDIGTLQFSDFTFTGTFAPGTYTLFQTEAPTVGNPTPISGAIANASGLMPGFEFSGMISEVGGDQIDLVIQSVPEPNAMSMLAGGIGLALGLQRFRRRRRASVES
jgi:autotransporter-associated beta strand protein